MLAWSLSFLIIAIIAGVLGYTEIMTTATEIAKIIFLIFLVLFFASLIMHYLKKIHFRHMGWFIVLILIIILMILFGFSDAVHILKSILKEIYVVISRVFCILFSCSD